MFSLRLLPRSMEQPKFSLLLPSTPSIKQQKHFRFLYSSCGNMKCVNVQYPLEPPGHVGCGIHKYMPYEQVLSWVEISLLNSKMGQFIHIGDISVYLFYPFLSIFFTKFFGPLTFGDALPGGAAVLAMITYGSNTRPCWEKICSELPVTHFSSFSSSFQFTAADYVVGEKFNAMPNSNSLHPFMSLLFGFKREANK